MTKDEAIKYLNEFIVLKKISNITEEKAIECFKLAVEALEQEQQPRWIPCSERLPEDFQEGYNSVLIDCGVLEDDSN